MNCDVSDSLPSVVYQPMPASITGSSFLAKTTIRSDANYVLIGFAGDSSVMANTVIDGIRQNSVSILSGKMRGDQLVMAATTGPRLFPGPCRLRAANGDVAADNVAFWPVTASNELVVSGTIETGTLGTSQNNASLFAVLVPMKTYPSTQPGQVFITGSVDSWAVAGAHEATINATFNPLEYTKRAVIERVSCAKMHIGTGPVGLDSYRLAIIPADQRQRLPYTGRMLGADMGSAASDESGLHRVGLRVSSKMQFSIEASAPDDGLGADTREVYTVQWGWELGDEC